MTMRKYFGQWLRTEECSDCFWVVNDFGRRTSGPFKLTDRRFSESVTFKASANVDDQSANTDKK